MGEGSIVGVFVRFVAGGMERGIVGRWKGMIHDVIIGAAIVL